MSVTLQQGWTSQYPPGHIHGLVMTNAADTVNDITIAAGNARDDTNAVNITLSAAITKQIDAAWAVGTNAGGINTGAVADSTWYEVHLIYRSDTGVVDAMFTTTANRATLPASYTHKRRIGWVRRLAAGAGFVQFTQVGNIVTMTTQVNDGSIAGTATAAQLTLTAPPSTVARFRADYQSNTGTANTQAVVLSEVAEGNVTPAGTTGIASLTGGDSDVAAGVMSQSAGHFTLRLNSSSQIEYDFVAANGTLDVSTYGWIDERGRETTP